MTDKTFYIETLGCQMNKSDTEKISGILNSLGYERREAPEEASLLIMNTCSIRAASENKAYSHLGVWKGLKKKNPEIKIAMCGCVAQQTKEKIFHKAPHVDLIFGTHNIYELSELMQRLEKGERVCSILKNHYESPNGYECAREKGRNAWLPIIDGCDYFCTYCVVPYTRGRQKSRMPEDIIKEAREIASKGYGEITLLGQTVDSYGNDLDDESITLANLLKELNEIDEIHRLRFVTSHPADITDDLIYAVKELDKVCEFFHIPMQSGSSEVLKRMRRPYTREHYIELVNKIRREMPDVGITSDFIAGFPGETQEQFEETLSIIDEIVFDHCNTAAYSPRKQTPAAVWKDQIAFEEKKRRLNILNDRVRESVKKSHEKYIGSTIEVYDGRARSNKVVNFDAQGADLSKPVMVKIKEASVWSLIGELV